MCANSNSMPISQIHIQPPFGLLSATVVPPPWFNLKCSIFQSLLQSEQMSQIRWTLPCLQIKSDSQSKTTLVSSDVQRPCRLSTIVSVVSDQHYQGMHQVNICHSRVLTRGNSHFESQNTHTHLLLSYVNFSFQLQTIDSE